MPCLQSLGKKHDRKRATGPTHPRKSEEEEISFDVGFKRSFFPGMATHLRIQTTDFIALNRVSLVTESESEEEEGHPAETFQSPTSSKGQNEMVGRGDGDSRLSIDKYAG